MDVHAWTYGTEMIIKDPSDPRELRHALGVQTQVLIENGADPVLMAEMILLIKKNERMPEFYRTDECNALKLKLVEQMIAYAEANPHAAKMLQQPNPEHFVYLQEHRM
jgi:hypothetical protein